MKYEESVEQSAEFLRLALPLMSQQAAALHPISYAVWYEYVSGRNRALQEEINQLTGAGRVLDEHATYALHARHISGVDEQTAHKVTQGFQRVLADMSRSAAHAGDHAHRFGETLRQWRASFPAHPVAGMEQLIARTGEMSSTVSSLRAQLDESHNEIERLREEVSRAREDALIDGLTGLTNRKGFDQALTECLAAMTPESQGLSLLITDIDHFKNINDHFGHLFGDKVIRAVAQILKQNIKGRDIAARFGGEEFVILLPDTPLDGAHVVAERIRSTIESASIRRHDNQQAVARITVSLGVASYRFGETASDLVSRVDAALYAAKNQGRNRVTLATLNA